MTRQSQRRTAIRTRAWPRQDAGQGAAASTTRPRGEAARCRRASAGLSEQARARLEEMIVSLELAPGSIWSEAELSAKLGIGRTPVREALQRLEGDHLVQDPAAARRADHRDQRGRAAAAAGAAARARPVDCPPARRAAARRRSARSCSRWRSGWKSRTAEGDDILPYLRDHYELKNFLAECARNPFVARAVMPCYAMSRRFYYLHHRQARDLAVATRHHAEVIRAVAIGDEKKAAAASDRLMDYVEEFTRATVTNRF